MKRLVEKMKTNLKCVLLLCYNEMFGLHGSLFQVGPYLLQLNMCVCRIFSFNKIIYISRPTKFSYANNYFYLITE